MSITKGQYLNEEEVKRIQEISKPLNGLINELDNARAEVRRIASKIKISSAVISDIYSKAQKRELGKHDGKQTKHHKCVIEGDMPDDFLLAGCKGGLEVDSPVGWISLDSQVCTGVVGNTYKMVLDW